jgi:very-short-patch-repair endonuclease
MSKIPQALSIGEEMMALHLRANDIAFEREVCLIPGRKWRVDFLLSPLRLVVEVEGGSHQMGRHQRPMGFEADCSKYNALMMAGYTVLRYTTAMVQRGDAIRDIVHLAGACTHLRGEDDDRRPGVQRLRARAWGTARNLLDVPAFELCGVRRNGSLVLPESRP